jgi:hypothetical protein
MNTIIYFTETYLGKFNTPEYVNLMDRFISQTQAQGEEVLHYQKADMDRMKELFGQLQNNVARSMALAETPELVALDSERTSLGQYIINSVRNAQSLPIKQKSDAAKQLYAVLRAYVGFYNQPAPQKTATLDGMLLDLSSEELAEYITTLGLTECVEALTLKNAQYKVKVDARTQARSALHSTADSATLRTEMDALYKYITTVAFAHNVITPSEDITLYINNMNAVISEITASYNQRNAKRKKTEEDPTQPPLDATLGAESEPEASESTE